MSRSALAAGLRHLRRQLASQQPNQENDEQLLHAFTTRREDSAFAVLMRRHGPMVLNVCRRVLGHEQDAEDAIQATFLVLVRNANSLRNKTSLASFLYGTAYRIAMKAKQAAARRRKHESQSPSRSPADPADELSWREVRAWIDEEIARLPEKYRSVFVLCCLENLSRAEAGQRLGLKERTVLSRLAEARKRLAQRLSRRGVELTAVLAVIALAADPASALPAGLMATTIEAALAGEGLAGIVSASVVELVQGATAGMMVSKAKMTTMVLVVSLLAVATSGSLVCWNQQASGPLAATSKPPAAKGNDKSNAAPSKSEAAKTMEIQGRVLGPDGEARAGARILLLGLLDGNEQQELLPQGGKVRQLAVSASNGRFSIAVPKAKTEQDYYLIAQSADAGIDFFDVHNLQSGKPIEFRLVKDHVIRGRIVNTEGRPVGGVRVAVNHIGIYPNNSLDSFLVFWKNRPFNWGLRGGVKNIWSGAGSVLFTTTDPDGRFALHGVGAERLVSLRLSGGGIAADELLVVNRAGFDPKLYNQATRDNLPKGESDFYRGQKLYGPDVSTAVAAEKVIRGTVTEADTGRVRPGVVVRLTRKNGNDHDGGEYLHLRMQAKTDAQGRYEIHGGHKAKSYMVEVGGDEKTGYLGRCVWAQDSFGYRPVTANIRVRKGVIVTGKIIDKTTGKPLDGYVLAADLNGNPFVKEYSDDSGLTVIQWATAFWSTNADGVFRAVTIPGPVLLMGETHRHRAEYKSNIPDPKFLQYFEKEGGSFYRYRGSGFGIVQGNFCKVLQLKPGVAVVEQNIVLERQRRNVLGVVKIEDAEGRPLSEAYAWGAANRMDGDSCTIYGDAKNSPRLLIFFEKKRNLAATLTVRAGEKLPPVVKLQAMGSVKGRLLDADGKPLEGIVVGPRYRDGVANNMDNHVHEARPIASNADGVFILDSLIPELPFELLFRRGRRDFARETKSDEATMQVKPGECCDGGAIQVKLLPEKKGE